MRLALFALATLLASSPALHSEVVTPSMTVSGHGEITSQPDMASFTLSVVTQAATAKDALSANSEKMRAVLEVMRSHEIPENAIQTSGLSVSPVWDQAPVEQRVIGQDPGTLAPRISGYVARNGISVRVDDLTRLGVLLDAAVSDGANSLGEIIFGMKDSAPVLAEARRASVKDALDQAQLYAEASGMAITRITSISPMGYARPMMARGKVMALALEAQAVPISEGELTTSADVSITVELKPLP
ncbi:SIMPL domain-containing protein [Paracoccus litorisediminis]|uniref:SIMPL domain-containing protein n=1 Tax=Paracoccus litorisediminis TaxID=2006130 RepID=UPI003732BB8D